MDELREIDVSVVVAAYNCAPFVDRAINSALSQEDVSLEVIVVDDCSSDNSADVVRALAKQDKRVRLVQLEKNGGPSAARNAGIAVSRGTWISVLDADDAYAPGRISRLVEAAERLSVDFAADNFLYFDAQSGEIGRPALSTLPKEELVDLHSFLRQARPYATEADYGLLKPIFRRSFLIERHITYPTEWRHGEDFLIYVNILLHTGRMLLLREPGYIYTTRSSGWSRTAVDYWDQVEATARLMKDRRVAADKSAKHLLSTRKKALLRLSTERACHHHMVSGNHLALVRAVFGDFSNADIPSRILSRAITKKIASKFKNV
ncbi:glycosyltransferase family 2 protein [Rhizobium laguerreae]|uniref:Glycosyltransferase family 2 protein n=1 Tax=Rhizobium laguerreae TaxID=1076926 RepID=A0A7Y2RBZ2_9HYPH|nr:glycosyltransferase family 2 protein [Rhizobium laguerreae]NNH68047.1 glycosyltransferase family 2 protein [Rhizobium laguerreae]